MRNNFFYTIFFIPFFILYISSMYPWFFWDVKPIILPSISLFFIIIYAAFNYESFLVTKFRLFLSFVLLLLFLWLSRDFNINGILENIIKYLYVLLIVNLKNNIKIQLLDFVTKGMACLLGISLFFYILFLCNIPLPYNYITYLDGRYPSYNYYFFIIDKDVIEYYRFKSVFMEPGHLIMGLIPLIFINKFNFKKLSVAILILAVIFTLSLAGYITLIFSLVFFMFNGQKNNKYKISVLFVFFFLSIFFLNISEDNIFFKAIISRLEIVDGDIAGNNRFSDSLQLYYKNFIKSKESIVGIGSKYYSMWFDSNSGYKQFIIQFGFIGTFLSVLIYLLMLMKYKRYEIFGFTILIFLLLIQNSYPFWFCILFAYLCGPTYILSE